MGADPLLGADPLSIQSLWLAQTDHMGADP